MEDKLPTQEKSNKFLESIRENLNYIYIILMFLVNILISCCSIVDGEFIVNVPKTALAWCLWLLQIAMNTSIGVLVLFAFRRQGIKLGHAKIKDTYDNYLKALARPNSKAKPRSLKQYMTKESLKDSISKFIIIFILASFTGSIILSFNWNNIVSLIGTTVLSIGFGIHTMLNAEEFVVTELVLWYNNKIKELEESQNEQRGNTRESRARLATPNRVQQKKECRTRQTANNNKKSDTTNIKSSTRRISS